MAKHSIPPNNKKLAQEWFTAAKSDFDYAAIGLKQTIIYPQIAFLSQQVAEKYLKGFLSLRGNEPPRIHDLPLLLNKCLTIEKQLEILLEPCELLAGFYLETRYPPDIPLYTKEEILSAFTAAKLVKDTIDKLLR